MPLGYALVSRLAKDQDVRVLAIKGPVLQLQGLRSEHQSSDVDVLVDPATHHLLVAGLGAVGWAPRFKSTTANLDRPHSVPVVHRDWPLELDVHDRFPGFLADESVVFEALWRRRTTAVVAGRDVLCTDLVGSVLVAALHLLRHPQRRRDELETMAERCATLLTSEHRTQLVALARETGAGRTVAPLLQLLGLTPVESETDERFAAEWELSTHHRQLHSVAWVREFSRTPLRGWPRLAKRALLLTEEEIRFLYSDLPPGRRGLLEGRLRRARLGARSLPSALWKVLVSHRGRSCTRRRRRRPEGPE